ncbi:hypothetical protein DS031_19315 [Bacillus taeanensis]|uniref:DUF111 domain-containing protein n=1 Tax=Bacillus taeanensis TaxID=273032 RepID=A0A366XV13_9BACI|nr:hypothetical protein DS031_19315 [Bacillus taeanensis]
MVKVEVNLDDMPGEWLGYVMEQLFEAGANDVFYIPIYMKKNRPGVMLQLLCEKTKLDEMKTILFTETTTLGIRYYPVSVHRLARTFYKVSTEWGDVTVKEGLYKGIVVQSAPEYEDCRKIASENKISIKEVYRQVWEKIKN